MEFCKQSLKIIAAALIAGSIISSCGGGDSDDPYAPREISKEHEGLSLSELKSIASDISYYEIIGHPGIGTFFDMNNPKISENIEKHTGTLIYSQGFIHQIFSSEDESRRSVWFCPKVEYTSEKSTKEEFNCREALFLLYDLDRGPSLSVGDVVELAGIVTGAQKRGKVSSGPAGSRKTYNYHPAVSVIKANYLGVSDWDGHQNLS